MRASPGSESIPAHPVVSGPVLRFPVGAFRLRLLRPFLHPSSPGSDSVPAPAPVSATVRITRCPDPASVPFRRRPGSVSASVLNRLRSRARSGPCARVCTRVASFGVRSGSCTFVCTRVTSPGSEPVPTLHVPVIAPVSSADPKHVPVTAPALVSAPAPE